MPTLREHAESAEQNNQLLATVTPGVSPAWCAVIAFYTAVHLVEQLSAAENLHFTNHPQRIQFLADAHPAILDPFQQLYQVGHAARYDAFNHFLPAYAEVVQSNVLEQWLPEIKQYIQDWLAIHVTTP